MGDTIEDSEKSVRTFESLLEKSGRTMGKTGRSFESLIDYFIKISNIQVITSAFDHRPYVLDLHLMP